MTNDTHDNPKLKPLTFKQVISIIEKYDLLGYSEGETDWGATIGYASIYKDEEQDDELVIALDEHCHYDTDSIYLYSSYTYLYDEDQQRILCVDRDKTIVKIRAIYTRHNIKICTD